MTQVRRPKRRVDGVLLLDKPYQISSNGALQKVRWLFSAAKGGHTGVLDPLATGLLPLCFGEATKFSSYLLDADKAYRASVCFGRTTTSGDLEGELVLERPIAFGQEQLRSAMQTFIGEIEQVPPMYSALKYHGKALYEYARAGIDIERQARRVTIYSLTLLSFDGREAIIDVLCSKGAYVRTLGQDLGEVLGCGAHLTRLRRLRTGDFALQNAYTLAQLETLSGAQRDALLLPVDVLVKHLPECELADGDVRRFCHGQPVRSEQNYAIISRFRVYRQVTREFLGLAEVREDAQLYPLRLMSTSVVVDSWKNPSF